MVEAVKEFGVADSGVWWDSARGWADIGELIQMGAQELGWAEMPVMGVHDVKGDYCSRYVHQEDDHAAHFDQAIDEAEEFMNTLADAEHYFGSTESGDWGLWAFDDGGELVADSCDCWLASRPADAPAMRPGAHWTTCLAFSYSSDPTEALEDAYLRTHALTGTWFDYGNQAWIVDGRYQDCNHPPTKWCCWAATAAWKPCGCYGRAHVGELVTPETVEQYYQPSSPPTTRRCA
jgi:hypothetical protein